MGVVVVMRKIRPLFLFGLLVIALRQKFLVAQALEAVFQLLFCFRQRSGGIQGFSVFIQNLVTVVVFLYPVMIAHFSKQLRFLLGHPSVFPAGPVLRQHQGLVEKRLVLLLPDQLFIALASQKVFMGQQCQTQAASHRGQQRQSAQSHGNEFQP